MHIFFCGDIMPGGRFPYQDSYIDEGLLAYMRSFDLRVGTLEAAIGSDYSFDENKMKGRCNIVYARDEDLFRVKELGMNVVSLANNHVFDLGEEGLINTCCKLDDLGIMYCGAGVNNEAARKPAIVSIEGKTIAFIGCCSPDPNQVGFLKVATNSQPGVNPIDESILEDIKEAKKSYDIVIVLPHWGKEHCYMPLPSVIDFSQRMIDAGADAVLGSHAHIAQPMIKYKGKPIVYGMGNFLFPDYYMKPPRPMWYPNPSEIDVNIKRVVGYPFPIHEPLIHVWPDKSRTGMVLDYSLLGTDVKVKFRFTHLSEDNIVSLKNNLMKSIKISSSQLFVRNSFCSKLFFGIRRRLK